MSCPKSRKTIDGFVCGVPSIYGLPHRPFWPFAFVAGVMLAVLAGWEIFGAACFRRSAEKEPGEGKPWREVLERLSRTGSNYLPFYIARVMPPCGTREREYPETHGP